MLIFIILINPILRTQDLELYKKSFEYIVNDTTTINEAFLDTNIISNNIKSISVSSTIVYISIKFIINDIVQYEYYPKNNEAKHKLIQCLIDKENSEYFTSYNIRALEKLNTCSDCGLILYFSQIEHNRLIAQLLISDKYNDDYENTFNKSYADITYLFYFDNSNIEKVFHTIGHN